MSELPQNRIKFCNREMQKAYFNPTQHFQSYPNDENGYCYEPPGQPYGGGGGVPSPQDDFYGSGCLPPTHMNSIDMCPPSADYGSGYANSCMQATNCQPQGAPITPSPPILKTQQEVYPWMKEYRQNSKQRHLSNLSGTLMNSAMHGCGAGSPQ